MHFGTVAILHSVTLTWLAALRNETIVFSLILWCLKYKSNIFLSVKRVLFHGLFMQQSQVCLWFMAYT